MYEAVTPIIHRAGNEAGLPNEDRDADGLEGVNYILERQTQNRDVQKRFNDNKSIIWTVSHKPITRNCNSPSDSSKTRPVVTEGKYRWEQQLQGRITLRLLPKSCGSTLTQQNKRGIQDQEMIVQKNRSEPGFRKGSEGP